MMDKQQRERLKYMFDVPDYLSTIF